MSSFSEKLLTELNYQGKSQADLARFLNVRQSTVQQWIQRGSIPAADTALKISRFLDVSLEYLVDDDDSALNKPKKETNKFFERLKNELDYQNLTRADLSRALDIPTSSIRNWKEGSMPAADVALKIARFLNVSLEYLIDGTNPPQVIIRKEEKKDSELSDGEKEIVELYRELSDDDKEEIKDIMQMKIKRIEKNTVAR